MQKKIILITGSSGRLGKQIVKSFETNNLIIGQFLHTPILSTNSLTAIKADITDPNEVSSLINQIMFKYGHIDVLINNAAINPQPSAWNNITPLTWKNTFQVNVVGAWNCINTVYPIMLNQRSGTIVNIAAKAGIDPIDGRAPVYAASKAALINLTKALASTFNQNRIRINAIAPIRIAYENSQNNQSTVHVDIITNTIKDLMSISPSYPTGSTIVLEHDNIFYLE